MRFPIHRCLPFTLLAAMLPAAEIRLKGELKLSGQIVEMDHSGVIELQSPISEKPVFIQSSAIEKVFFDTQSQDAPTSSQSIELRNGDVLPVRILSLDEHFLKVDSTCFGSLSVPRAALAKLNFGLSSEKMIYVHEDEFLDWKHEDSYSPSWVVSKDSFHSQNQGRISREMQMPEKSKIRFSLMWSDQANFQYVYACSEPVQDAYVFDLTEAGISLYRESLDRRITFVSLNRFEGKRMDVEISIDRTDGLLELRINGESEGCFTDPILPRPTGNRVSLVNRAQRESSQQIRGLEVIECDRQSDRHRSAERGDPEYESLVGRNGEFHSGQLIGIREGNSSPVFQYQANFQNELLELPEEEISHVFMKNSEGVAQANLASSFLMQLRGNGSLHIDSCIFEDGKVKALHPLLGSLQFAQTDLLSLVCTGHQPEKTAQSQ
jgi:hypothetical protein